MLNIFNNCASFPYSPSFPGVGGDPPLLWTPTPFLAYTDYVLWFVEVVTIIIPKTEAMGTAEGGGYKLK